MKKFLTAITLLSIVMGLWAEEEKTWVLAASEFSLNQRLKENDIAQSYKKTLPSLILEQIAENLSRLPRAQEQLDRALFDLKTKRLSLFLQLSKEVKARDAVLLNDYGPRTLKRKLKEADKKVAAIEKDIKDNLSAVKDECDKRASQIALDKIRDERIKSGEIEESEPQKKRRTIKEYFKDLARKENERIELENVRLYQNDFEKLFDTESIFLTSQEKSATGQPTPSPLLTDSDRYTSYTLEKAAVDAHINALIVGNITVYGNFINLSVSLYRYPGATLLASAVDVGTKDDLKSIAISISNALTPRIADSMSVRLHIAIAPPEITNTATIAIDDVIYPSTTKEIIIPSGVHTITFSHKGYATESTTYAFNGARNFQIDVELKEDNPAQLDLVFSRPLKGDVYANGILQGATSPESRFTPITINNKKILGHFISEDGIPCDFLVETRYMNEGNVLFTRAKPFDRSDHIEKRRRWMYRAYSILIVSLIPTFVCYGNNASTAFAYNNARGVDRNTAQNWLLATNITTGISVACGVFFVYELVRYLISADTVLPVQARPIKPKKEFRIRNQETYAKIMAAQARQKAEDEEKTRALLDAAENTDKKESEQIDTTPAVE